MVFKAIAKAANFPVDTIGHNGHTEAMQLDHWIKSNKISVSEFASKIGVSHARTVNRYLNGERMPSPEIMQKINKVTNGQVTANDFYDIQ